MPIYSRWYVPDRVILIDLVGDVVISEWKAMYAHPGPGIPELERYHAIVRGDRLNGSPPLSTLSKLQPLPNLGWLFFHNSGTTRLGRFVASTVAQVARKDFRFIRTMAEADEVLRRVDPVCRDATFPPEDTLDALPIVQTIDHQGT